MNKSELIKWLKEYRPRNSYRAEDALYEAKEAGLISSFEHVQQDITDERRWGHDIEDVWKIDDFYLCFLIYVMTSDEGDDEMENIVEVVPEEVTVVQWKEV